MVRSWWEEGRGEGGEFDRQTNRQCDCISLISLGNWAKNKRFYLLPGIKKNVSYIFTKHLFLCILINSQDERGSLRWILSKELKGRAGGVWVAQSGIFQATESRAMNAGPCIPMPHYPRVHISALQTNCPLGKFSEPHRMHAVLLHQWWMMCFRSSPWCTLWSADSLRSKWATRKLLYLFRFMV